VRYIPGKKHLGLDALSRRLLTNEDMLENGEDDDEEALVDREFFHAFCVPRIIVGPPGPD
jgi:hypothetical protein